MKENSPWVYKVQNSKGKNALGLSTAVKEAVIQFKMKGGRLHCRSPLIFFLLRFQSYILK